MTERDPFDQWADDLTGDLVEPLAADQVAQVAAAAASAAAGAAASAGAAGAAAGVGTAVGVSTTVKVIASISLVTALGLGAAVAGILPDPVQNWVADLVDGIGIDLPRTGVTIPDVTIPDITVPDVVPDVTIDF